MPTILKTKNLKKIYQLTKDNKVEALNGVDLSIEEGELVSIMGPSGSGKSTLLHMIGLLDRPTSGEVMVDDHNIQDLSNKELAILRRNEIGFIFQTFNLLPRLNVYKNVLLPALYARKPRVQRQEKAKELLKKVGLEQRMKHKPNELSGGERQRVAIARALINNPKVILADEPTGNLDSHSGKEIMKLLRHINKEGSTIVIVTHDLNIAKQTNRIIEFGDGKIIN